MSTDTVVPEMAQTPSVFAGGRPPRRRVPELVSSFLGRDLFGVRLGVLLVIFPMMAATLALQLTSRQGWNHPPDSRYYLPMMSRDMGFSWSHSVHLEQLVSPGTHVSPWYFADNDPTWQMVRTRMLYPVLSIPFIWLWGLSGGSLAIPVLGTVLFVWAIARVLQRLYGPAVAALVAVGFSITVPVTGFTWAGTDTLAMGLAAVIVANLPIERRIGKANLVWLGAASVFIALTRQVGVLAPAMAGAGWLWMLVRERSWRNRWLSSLLVTAATTVVIQVLSMMLVKTDTAGVVGRGQTTYWGILRQFIHYLKIVTQEACTYMWHTDRILYALLIAAGVSVLARFASDATAVFIGAVGATYIITAGVGFSGYMRYEMIMFPAAAVAAGQLIQLLLTNYQKQPGSVEPAAAATAVALADVEAAEAKAIAAVAAVTTGTATGIATGIATDTATGIATDTTADTATDTTADPATDPATDFLRIPAQRRPRGLTGAVAATKPGRFLGLDQPRQDRWKPQLAFNAAVLAVVVGVSLNGSWSSTAAVPTSPSYEAAQGGTSYAVEPLAEQPAEQTLKIFFDQAVGLAHDSGNLQGAVDWVHTLRYRPTAPDQPGWATRDKDGTAVVHPSSMGQDVSMSEAFGQGLSLDSTVRSDTVKILSRQVSEYGEDVVFTIEDKSGVVHHGTATTLYPIWDKKDPATVTSMVFDS
ncbi:ArnT family glycosyltransferase [Catenulispora pinistramenti]|uniref:ArnT family glycosyltransferase n=1 Tax=Catenulispora pinistramenti TaxID=2705254 RepID=UPI001E2A6BE0|nr:glycosyltransferase family 39 protein [Catenulispora pinistramenti]